MTHVTFALIVTLAACVTCTTYHFGERTPASKLVHMAKVMYEAIPWKKRVKTYDYAGPADLKIKAIDCFDYQNSEASINITEGGIGTNHLTLRMKSQRSYRLEYAINIYQ